MKATKTLLIKGMHCASCARNIEHALAQTEGVIEAQVNFAAEQAKIEYDPDKVNEKKLVEVVKSLGYDAVEGEKLPSINKQKIEKDKELKEIRQKAIFSLILASLIVWGSFPFLMDFAPGVLKNFMVMWLLATPVQFWAGLSFYKATIPALKHRTANMDTLIVIGTTTAYLYSTVVTFLPQLVTGVGIKPEPYFDVSTVIIGLILLGRYFEARAKAGTSEAIKKLMGLQAKEAVVLLEENDKRLTGNL